MDDEVIFMILRVMAPAMGALAVSIMLWVPLVMYVIARWRQNKDPQPDPQHGPKFALHYFGAIALQLTLGGLALLLYTMVSKESSDYKGDSYRAAVGFLLAGGLVLGITMGLRRFTNDDDRPGVRRLFTGFNLITAGAVTLYALVAGFQLLLMKGRGGDGIGRLAMVVLLVYGGATAYLTLRLGKIAKPDDAHGGPPAIDPPVKPTATTTVGLPALGGGEFPPIEKS
jgi:hypothetical protein